jgi:phospholipase A1/A2
MVMHNNINTGKSVFCRLWAFGAGSLLLWLPSALTVADALQDAPEYVTSTPMLEDQPVKTELRDIQIIAPEEFKPSIRNNLPQLMEKRQIEAVASDSPYVLLPHRPNYVMPFTYQTKPNNQELDNLLDHYAADTSDYHNAGYEHLEAFFQFSIKYVLREGALTKFGRIEVAYTNRSFWQAYNSDISKPFRETNHEPEIIYSWQPRNRWLDQAYISLNHQSNGQTSSLSRSWNRVIAGGATVFSNHIWAGRLWWRIPEGGGSDPYDPSDDDNPDIEDYLGYGELVYLHVWGNQNVSVMLRNNLDRVDNRGAVEIGWTFPVSRKLKGYVQYFNGYGESLIDYNHYQERIGVGIKLSDWF